MRASSIVCLAFLLAWGGAAAQTPQKEKPSQRKFGPSQTQLARPGEAPQMSAGRIEETGPGEYQLTGEVDFRYGIARLFADTVRYSESTRTATAEGNVVLQFGASQVSGDRIEVNLDSEYAVVDNARAYVEPDVILQAERLERIGEESYLITRGTITTCTQPTPYWSFYVGSAIINVGRYAHMKNASLWAGHVPFFWTPYLVWPIKEDRAPGLLLPHFGYTQKRGAFISDALYIPMGRSVDATIQFDFYNGAVSGLTEQLPQHGEGLELRYVPAAEASGILTAYYLREKLKPEPGDEVEERSRYHVSLAHTQRLEAGFKLLVDYNAVSDLDYFLDFGREIRYTTSPTVFSQVDLSRQTGSWALNVRLNRQLQFIDVVEIGDDPTTPADEEARLTEDLTLWRLPEVELRGRGIRLGRSRFYLTFVSSVDGLARRRRTVDVTDELETQQTTYGRADLFPTITGNFTPVPWLDVSPVVAFRSTYYSESDADPGPDVDPTGPSVLRNQFRLGISAVGPRLFRLYGSDAPGATRYKHTFEPRVAYNYVPASSGTEKIIPFDEIDSPLPTSNLLTYSLTSRLFAKKPPQTFDQRGLPPPVLDASFASLVLGEEAPTRHQDLGGSAAEAVLATPPEPPAPEVAGQPGGPAPGSGAPPAGEGETATEPGQAAETPEPAPSTGGETYVPPTVSTGTGSRSPFGRGTRAPGSDKKEYSSVGAVEIATFDLTQHYSLDKLKPLTSSAKLDAESPFSSVDMTVRYNPTYSASLDVRASYDILFDNITSVSLSGNIRERDRAYLRLSWFLKRDLEGISGTADPQCANDPTGTAGRNGSDTGRCFNDSSQIRAIGGFALLRRKITADLEGSYDIQKRFLQDQRYRVGYNTQCCGVLVEMSKRSFLTATEGATTSTEYRFVLNLRGVGTFLDLNGRPQ